MFKRLDLPTFERPAKAISGPLGAGICSRFCAPAVNSASLMRTSLLVVAMRVAL